MAHINTFFATSPDGMRVAYDRCGAGPAIVLLHGGSEDQLRLLKRFSKRIVLALDPDAAGQAAVLRGLDAARQSLQGVGEISFSTGEVDKVDHSVENAFDAPSLLHHAASLQADIRVVTIPDRLDPDELVQRDPLEWQNLIGQAKPIVVHVMESLAIGRNLDDPAVKTGIAGQVLWLIEDLPNPIERDAYRQKLARFLKLHETAFMGLRATGQKTRRPRPRAETLAQEQAAVTGTTKSPSYLIEAHILGILLRRPGLLYRLDRDLQESALSRLSPEDFEYTDHQVLFSLVRQSLEQDAADADQYLHQNLPPALADLTDELLAKSAAMNSLSLEPVDDRLLEDLFRGVIKIRRLGLDESINQLRFLQEDAQQQGDLRAVSYLEMVSQYQRSRNALDQASLKLSERRQE